jgi:tol-pal system protein YbgF
LATLLLSTAIAAPAWAQDNLADTLSRIERQLLSLERTVYRGDPPPAPTPSAAPSGGLNTAAAAQIQVRIDDFEQEMRSLTGQVERMSFDLRQLTSRLDKLVADVDFRLRTLEQGGQPLASAGDAAALDDGTASVAENGRLPLISSTPGGGDATATIEPGSTVRVIGTLTETQIREAATTTASATPDSAGVAEPGVAGAVSLPDGPPADQYNYARSFLMRRDFASAEVAFREFIEANPDSNLIGNAQYWLGETYYVRENYLDAARAFAEGYQNFPASGKAPDNLLKLGLALANLDRKDDACITLSRLDSEYPDASANIRQRAAREHDRLGCG